MNQEKFDKTGCGAWQRIDDKIAFFDRKYNYLGAIEAPEVTE